MSELQAIQMKLNSDGARSDSTALGDHPRNYGFIQNQGSNNLYVRFGAACSTTNYDFILESGDVAEFDDDGIVTIAGTSPSYTAFER